GGARPTGQGSARSAPRPPHPRRRQRPSGGAAAASPSRPARGRDRPVPLGHGGDPVRHFLSTRHLSQPEFEALLARGADFREGAESEALRGRHVGLVFFNPSLRTRVSMEIAVSKLGGTPITLSVGSDAWAMEYRDGTVMEGGAVEHVREGAGVLGRYCDMLGVRSFPEGKDYEQDRREPVLSAFAKYSGVPVV